MGLFGSKKDKSEKMLMVHYDGIPSFRANCPCHMILDEENSCLRFEKFGSKDSAPVSLPLCKITKVGSVNVEEIEQQSKVGRAIVGGLLFGKTGAVLGALSAGEKKKINMVYIINYVSDGEAKSISLKENGNLNYFKFQKRLKELLPSSDQEDVDKIIL